MTIEKLEALERAATAGPWTEWIGNTSVHFGVRIETNVHWMLVGGDGVVCKCDNMDSECKRQAVQDAAFIAAARNALGPLLAVAKAAKAYCDQRPNTSTAHANLVFAVAQLEATP